MGLESAPQVPLTVSAREFDLGRPNVQAPNVQALADAVRQGYIGASDIQQRALMHPTLVAEAEAGPKLVQAKLAAAQAETTPEMLAAKATAAKAQAEKLQAEAEVNQQMAKLGEEGRGQVKYLREKGVILRSLDPVSIEQQFRDYRDFETNHSIAKANQERAVKVDRKEVQGQLVESYTSNGMTVDATERPQIDEAARAGAEWLTAHPNFNTWESAGKPVFGGKPGTVQASALAAPTTSTFAPSAPRTILAPNQQIIGPAPVAPVPATAPPVASPTQPSAPLQKPPIPGGPQGTWDPNMRAMVYPKAKERIPGEQVEKAGTAETAVSTALQMNEAYMDLIATRRKMIGPIRGRAAKLALAKEWDEKVALFQQTATSLLAPVAKGIFNETGVLSDKDVARYESVFPSIQDTPDVGLKKLAAITKTILTAYQNKAKNWEAFGYDAGPMQGIYEKSAQQAVDTYAKYGLDFNGASVDGQIFEAIDAGRTRVKNGITYAAVPGPTGSVVFVEVPKGFAPPQKTPVTPTGKKSSPPAGEKANVEYTFPAKSSGVEGIKGTNAAKYMIIQPR